MSYNDDLNKVISKISDSIANIDMDSLIPKAPKIEIPDINIEPINYENSIFKDLANDINSSNKVIADELERLNKSQDDSSKLNHMILYISIAALIVSLLPYLIKLYKIIINIISNY